MDTSTENQRYSEADVRRWRSMHKDRGGSFSWEQISEAEGGTPTGNAIRKAVIKLEKAEKNGAPPVAGVPSDLPPAHPTVEVLDPHILPANWVQQLYENAKEQARLRLAGTKEETVYHVRVPDNLPVYFVWTADQHLLDAGTDHDLWDEDVAIWTSTPGVYIGAGGDWANWFSPAVLPRAMPANTLPSDYTEPIVRWQMERLHGKEKRILFGVVGNHDEFPGATGWHPIDRIYRDLGIPNLGSGGNVHLIVGEVEYVIAARHSFNFNSSLNDTNSHRQLWVQAGCPDMVATAHLHHPTLHHRTFDGRDTLWFRNGSYKRHDHHAQSKNFVHTRPEPADQPGVILFPDRKKMIGFRNYRDGLPLLAALREQYSRRTA